MLRKTVIITGASSGIGRATAIKFAKEGYNVVFTYLDKGAKAVENEIKSYGVECKAIKMNLGDIDGVNKAMDKAFKAFEYVDCLVCNAGISEPQTLLINKSDELVCNVLDINLKGTLICNKIGAKYFTEHKHGNIVNVASILGRIGSACEVAYSASKAGIIGMTKALSKEIGRYGVRVNAVGPGMVKTAMTAEFSEAENNMLKQRTMLGRLGEPEDIAEAIFFLASDKASFITGECLEVSGGLIL